MISWKEDSWASTMGIIHPSDSGAEDGEDAAAVEEGASTPVDARASQTTAASVVLVMCCLVEM